MKSIVIILFSIALSSSVFAQERTPRVDGRQDVQRARINQGTATGELTRREAHALRHEQKHIRRAERRAKSDGDVTAQERRRLDNKQDRANRHIRRAKHNRVDANAN
jgi:hypothetical protein